MEGERHRKDKVPCAVAFNLNTGVVCNVKQTL